MAVPPLVSNKRATALNVEPPTVSSFVSLRGIVSSANNMWREMRNGSFIIRKHAVLAY